MKKTIEMAPMGKPRMTQQDKWRTRRCVARFWAWKDEFKLRVGKIPEGACVVNWVAYFPMPKSWSAKKKREMAGTLHQQKPDRDNIDKAILDSLFKDDSRIAGCAYMWKYWDDGRGARIEIEIY